MFFFLFFFFFFFFCFFFLFVFFCFFFFFFFLFFFFFFVLFVCCFFFFVSVLLAELFSFCDRHSFGGLRTLQHSAEYFHFLRDHWADCGIFENRDLLMYTQEGLSSIANFIIAYEESQ